MLQFLVPPADMKLDFCCFVFFFLTDLTFYGMSGHYHFRWTTELMKKKQFQNRIGQWFDKERKNFSSSCFVCPLKWKIIMNFFIIIIFCCCFAPKIQAKHSIYMKWTTTGPTKIQKIYRFFSLLLLLLHSLSLFIQLFLCLQIEKK